MATLVAPPTDQAATNNYLQTETVSCNLCASQLATTLFEERYTLLGEVVDLRINRCDKCHLVYVSPRLTSESTGLVYQHDSAHTISHNYCWDGDQDDPRFTPLLKRVEEIVPGGRLLDIGCGGGQLLAQAKRSGRWDVVGIEPSVAAAAHARKVADCPVYTGTLDTVDVSPGNFDVITMLGVLEHVHDPLATVRDAQRLLKPGGLLAVYVPNFNYLRLKDAGVISRIRSGKLSQLHPQEHLHHFTPSTLQNLIRQGGFDIQRIDVGQPFMRGNWVSKLVKKSLYYAALTAYATIGVHCAGIELIARRESTD